MRNITQNAVNAFMASYPRNWKQSNTLVSPANNDVYLCLFGHIIAIRNKVSGLISICNAGYFTNTTKERLNGLPGVRIQQIKGKWFLNGKEWDGKLIEIKP